MNTSVQAFEAGGTPFSMLNAMKGGGSKSKKQDRKTVLEAWKCFRKDTKSIKDKGLKLRIRRVEQILKNKVGGDDANGNEISDENTMPETPVSEVQQEANNTSDQLSGISDRLGNMEKSIATLQQDVETLKINTGLEPDEHKKAVDALNTLTEIVNKYITPKEEPGSESSEQSGGKRSKSKAKKHVKWGGEAPGQYAINNIYAPEVGSSVTVGGKKKHRGGRVELAPSAPTSYNLLDNGMHKGGNSTISITNPLSNLMDAVKTGGKRHSKRGGELGFPGETASVNGMTAETPCLVGAGSVSTVPSAMPSSMGNVSLGGGRRRRS